MPTKKRTVSVRLDASAARRLERAAHLMKQSRGAFLERAGDETARRVLLDWAVSSYRRGERSFSELAGETGLAVEEIMDAVGQGDREAALAMFLASCKTVAESEGKPEFMRLGQAAVDDVRAAGG
jgi:hypothetical protein